MNFKKRFFSLAILLGIVLLLWGCGNQASENETTTAPQSIANDNTQKTAAESTTADGINNLKGKKVLIAYFSHTKHTKQFAEIIHQNIGGDLFEIEPKNPYPTDNDTVIAQAKQEVNSGYTPELKQDIDTSSYDVIFIGTPVWWYTFAPPVRTFLTQHDLSGKIVVPFTTHKGSGLSGIDSKIKELQPNADILTGLAVYDDTAQKESGNIKKWLQSLSF